jgi:hypothetical protein
MFGLDYSAILAANNSKETILKRQRKQINQQIPEIIITSKSFDHLQ